METWRRREAQQVILDRLTVQRDGESSEEQISAAAHDAVETATTVKITSDILGAAVVAYDRSGPSHTPQLGAALVAAFEAAGFEVVQ